MTKERLASYDRSITHEPDFNTGQKEGLRRDLTTYLATLRVHTLRQPASLRSLKLSLAQVQKS